MRPANKTVNKWPDPNREHPLRLSRRPDRQRFLALAAKRGGSSVVTAYRHPWPIRGTHRTRTTDISGGADYVHADISPTLLRLAPHAV